MPSPFTTGPASAILAQASSQGVENRFAALDVHFPLQMWLSPTNRYVADCIAQIEIDLSPAGTGIDNADLAAYISASVPLHCSDGWTFLARSIDCYVSGSPHQAAHFAYYAELRAAMSILASQGIGVFNNRHFALDVNGDCHQIPIGQGTHKFAWNALSYWSNKPASGTTLLDIFTVSGLTISDWFQSKPGDPVVLSLASTWLKEWGLDLDVLGEDHLIRNSGSYRPNDISPLSTGARECSSFLLDLWSLFEPATTRFENLDKHLLKTLVRQPFEQTGRRATLKSMYFRSFLTAILGSLGLGDAEKARYKAFLASPAGTPQLLTNAAHLGPANDLIAHERVMSRAALLLRVASGFTAKLIQSAPFQLSDLSFWTSPIAERRAFWAVGEPLDEFTDLWLDVSEAVDVERSWVDSVPPGAIGMYPWRLMRDAPIRYLSEIDRIGLWGLQR